MYILDTNVVSEMKKLRPHGAVTAWLRAQPPHNLHLSAITILEIQRGAERTRRQNATLAQSIDEWIDALAGVFQILPMDAQIAREGARQMVGKPEDLFEDAMIAATARLHGLTVATRNVRDFRGFPVEVFNPFHYSN